MFTPFKLERYFSKYEFSTQYLLSSSDCEAMTVDELLEFEPSERKKLGQVWLGYTESKGDPELRDLVCNLYSKMSSSNVLVHSGAQEAIHSFFHSVIEPNDHIVVLTPTYQSLYSTAIDKGIEVSEFKLKETDQGWDLDVDELEPLIQSKTKAVIVNFPNNPTGFLPSPSDFKSIVDVCRKHDVYLFCDEVYRGLEYGDTQKLPAVCDVYEKGISLGVLSKTYGLPGLRIGWIATQDETVFEKMSAFKDYLTICNSAPSEFLAKIALRNHEAIANNNNELVATNLELAHSFFKEFSNLFTWHEPKAGPVSFVGLKNSQADSFCGEVRERAKTLLLPSTVYDYGNNHVRFGLGRRNFRDALEALARFLKGQ